MSDQQTATAEEATSQGTGAPMRRHTMTLIVEAPPQFDGIREIVTKFIDHETAFDVVSCKLGEDLCLERETDAHLRELGRIAVAWQDAEDAYDVAQRERDAAAAAIGRLRCPDRDCMSFDCTHGGRQVVPPTSEVEQLSRVVFDALLKASDARTAFRTAVRAFIAARQPALPLVANAGAS